MYFPKKLILIKVHLHMLQKQSYFSVFSIMCEGMYYKNISYS